MYIVSMHRSDIRSVDEALARFSTDSVQCDMHMASSQFSHFYSDASGNCIGSTSVQDINDRQIVKIHHPFSNSALHVALS